MNPIVDIPFTESPAPETPPAPPIGSDLLEFLKAKPRLDAIINGWGVYKEAAKARRTERYIDLDIKKMRAEGKLKPNETMIPQRIIDSNIERAKADAMAFLNSSHRLAYFRCVEDPLQDTRQIETDVTKGCTYEGWYDAFDSHYDGAALHGWDFIEVVYDESKPLRVAFEHVGFDKLMFNTRVKDIQNSPIVIREYDDITSSTLETFVDDFGFSPSIVGTLLSKYTDKLKDDHTYTIYRIYFKIKQCVYVAWYSKEAEANDWLKPPQKYYCGIREKSPVSSMPFSIGAEAMQLGSSLTAAKTPLDKTSGVAPSEGTLETSNIPSLIPQAPIDPFVNAEVDIYPIFIWKLKNDEQETIVDHKGRAFLDGPQQEAVTAVTSGYVNRIIKASGVYVCPAKENDDTTNTRLEEIELESDTILPAPVQFFEYPMPDPGVLQALQYLDASNSRQTGKIATSVSNRKDARKTAEELSQAKQEEQKITSTSLATYSEFLRQLFSFAWKIIQSQAIEGTIKICQKQIIPPAPQVLPGMVPPPTPEPIWQNDIETLSKIYDVRPAGEVDVVQRNQKLQEFQQDWPVLGQTSVGPALLEDYIRLRYPLQADRYIEILKAGNPAKQIVQSLLTVLQGSLQPEEVKALGPQGQQQLMQVVSQAQQFLASPV